VASCIPFQEEVPIPVAVHIPIHVPADPSQLQPAPKYRVPKEGGGGFARVLTLASVEAGGGRGEAGLLPVLVARRRRPNGEERRGGGGGIGMGKGKSEREQGEKRRCCVPGFEVRF
jgi:hypothetical protein